MVHNWKARWFVLMPDKLLYYKYEGGKRDSCQRGKILLRDCVLTCPFLECENRPVSSFRLTSADKYMYFSKRKPKVLEVCIKGFEIADFENPFIQTLSNCSVLSVIGKFVLFE